MPPTAPWSPAPPASPAHTQPSPWAQGIPSPSTRGFKGVCCRLQPVPPASSRPGRDIRQASQPLSSRVLLLGVLSATSPETVPIPELAPVARIQARVPSRSPVCARHIPCALGLGAAHSHSPPSMLGGERPNGLFIFVFYFIDCSWIIALQATITDHFITIIVSLSLFFFPAEQPVLNRWAWRLLSHQLHPAAHLDSAATANTGKRTRLSFIRHQLWELGASRNPLRLGFLFCKMEIMIFAVEKI